MKALKVLLIAFLAFGFFGTASAQMVHHRWKGRHHIVPHHIVHHMRHHRHM